MPIARLLLISGRVQGVGFREWTVETARDLGVSGWVRNLRDGRVETWIEGDAASIETMIARCWEGPRLAHVDAVEASDGEPEGARTFERR